MAAPVEKALGPADEQAFMSKLDSAFHEATSAIRKKGPQTADAIVASICAALQGIVPAKSMGGLGIDTGDQGLGDMEGMAENAAEGGSEAGPNE